MESDRGFYSDSLTEAQAFSLWRCVGVGRVILRISNPNKEFKVKEKAAHFSLCALLLSFTHFTLEGETNDIDLGGPHSTRHVHSCGMVPAGLCPRQHAPLMWPSQQLTENSGRQALGTRPLTPWAFFSSSPPAANGRALSTSCHGNGKTALQCPEQMSHERR